MQCPEHIHHLNRASQSVKGEEVWMTTESLYLLMISVWYSRKKKKKTLSQPWLKIFILFFFLLPHFIFRCSYRKMVWNKSLSLRPKCSLIRYRRKNISAESKRNEVVVAWERWETVKKEKIIGRSDGAISKQSIWRRREQKKLQIPKSKIVLQR